jgi:Domain of unknown function (DUF4382)
MKVGRLSARVAVMALLVAVSACGSSPASSGGDTRLSIYLTDAAGDVDRAWVEITEISFRMGSETLTYVPDETGLIELTALVDDLQLLTDEQEIEPGTLTELRLVIGDAVLESKSGDVYVLGDPELPDGLQATGELQCPSCQQSGIKIKVSNDQVEVPEGDYALVLDFDVAQTFGHRAGSSGRWIMHPVVHADLVATELVDGVADDLQGVVVLASVEIPHCPAGSSRTVEDFVPTATAQTLVDGDGQPIVRTGVVHADGTFAMGGLEPDVYTLGYEAAFDFGTDVLGFQATVVPTQVTVTEGGSAGVAAYTITGATCTPAV